MKQKRTYTHKNLKEDLKLNYTPESALVLAFDAITNKWLENVRKKYSTYKEQHTHSTVYFAAVNNIVVRISFNEQNMDAIDHEEEIMMKTQVHMAAEKMETLDTLMSDLLKFKENCTEEAIKRIVVDRLKRGHIKTYHLQKKAREYYGC